jgi:hypothetical protein
MKRGDWRSGGCGSVVLFLGGLELEEIHSSRGLRIGSEMLLDLLGSSNPTISCEFVFFFTSIISEGDMNHILLGRRDLLPKKNRAERNPPKHAIKNGTNEYLADNELVEYKHKFGSCNIATT